MFAEQAGKLLNPDFAFEWTNAFFTRLILSETGGMNVSDQAGSGSSTF